MAGMATRPTGRYTEIVTIAPTRCHNGHPLKPPNVQVFYNAVPGEDRRATGWRCWTCGDVVWEPAEPPAHT